MSPSLELIVPDAPRCRDHSLIHPIWPAVSYRTASWRNVGKPAQSTPPLFLTLNTCHLSAENLSLTTSASCIPLSYSLPIVHFVTVCFTLDHLLSHSHSPTSIKSLSPIVVSRSLVGCLPVSRKQLFLSAQPTPPIHWIFLVFSHSTSIAALHLVASVYPIIFPFNSGTLCALSTQLPQLGWSCPLVHHHHPQSFSISCLSLTLWASICRLDHLYFVSRLGITFLLLCNFCLCWCLLIAPWKCFHKHQLVDLSSFTLDLSEVVKKIDLQPSILFTSIVPDCIIEAAIIYLFKKTSATSACLQKWACKVI